MTREPRASAFHGMRIATIVAAMIAALGCGDDAPNVFDGLLHATDAGGLGGASGDGGDGGDGGLAGSGGEPMTPGGIGDPCMPLGCEVSLICRDQLCAAPAAEGEPCDAPADCNTELSCVDHVCAADGTLGAPCAAGNVCDESLGCFSGVCVDTINVRYCHCIFLNGGATNQSLALQLGDITIGPTDSETCSPCVQVPAGSTALPATVVTPGGTVLLDTTFIPDPSLTTVAFATGSDGTHIIETHCGSITGFCGP